MKRQHKLNLDQENKIIYDQGHRKCFFQKEFIHMQWSDKKLPKQYQNIEISQLVTIENKNKERRVKTFMFHSHIIFKTKKNGILCWIDYENSILEPINHILYGDGIKLTKCFDVLEFYGDMEKIWPLIKKYTIQLNFFQYYILIKKINSNDKTEVHRIRQKEDRNDYECKIYSKKQLNQQSELQLEKEIQILRRLNDDCIQKFYEIFENQDQIIIVSELLIGGSLNVYLQKWPLLSEEKALKLFFKLFKALAYMHSKGIMHRDLKPETIGLRLNGNLDNPCFTTFDLAEIVQIKDPDNEQEQGKYLFQRCGTPGYVAPEILKNQEYDCKVDVYSLGIIMFESLTGKKPFDNPQYQKIIEANEEGFVDLSNLKLSKEGLFFMNSILQPDPSERITSQMALNHYWFKNEKTSQMLEMKTHKSLKKYKIKSNLRQSIKNSPNSLPSIPKQGQDTTLSPIYITPNHRSTIIRYSSQNNYKNSRLSLQGLAQTVRLDKTISPQFPNQTVRLSQWNSFSVSNKQKKQIQNLIKNI